MRRMWRKTTRKEDENKNFEKGKKNMKLQPYIDFWASAIEADFCCPACVLLWCLIRPSVSPHPLSLSSLCCQSNQKQAVIFLLFCIFFPLPSQNKTLSLFPVRLPMPCFPYFGMSMCYLLTLCMNDNMSVYSYRESYPIPPLGCWQKNGLNVVQIQVFSVHLLFGYTILFFFS